MPTTATTILTAAGASPAAIAKAIETLAISSVDHLAVIPAGKLIEAGIETGPAYLAASRAKSECGSSSLPPSKLSLRQRLDRFVGGDRTDDLITAISGSTQGRVALVEDETSNDVDPEVTLAMVEHFKAGGVVQGLFCARAVVPIRSLGAASRPACPWTGDLLDPSGANSAGVSYRDVSEDRQLLLAYSYLRQQDFNLVGADLYQMVEELEKKKLNARWTSIAVAFRGASASLRASAADRLLFAPRGSCGPIVKSEPTEPKPAKGKTEKTPEEKAQFAAKMKAAKAAKALERAAAKAKEEKANAPLS